MTELWMKLWGVDASRIPEDAQTEFFWSHAPKSWAVFVMLGVAAAILYGVFYLYRREIQTCPPRKRVLLACVRAAVLAILLLIFMGPALAISQHRTIHPYVVLLLDDSLSMSIQDRYQKDAELQKVAKALGRDPEAIRSAPPSRAELVNEILKKENNRLIEELKKKGKLKILSFSHNVKLREAFAKKKDGEENKAGEKGTDPKDEDKVGSELERGDPVPPVEPAGTSTNISKGLREAMKAMAGNPLAGIIILSDGQNTEGDDPLNSAERAAKQNIPIFTLGIGDPNPPRNLKVAEMWAPESVFRDDPFVVQARLQAKGLDDTSINVELVRSKAGEDQGKDSGTVVDSKTVRMSGEEAKATVSFQYKPKAAGEYVFMVRVRPLPNELLLTDNHKAVPIKVLSEQAKVLMIAGAPTWEYRMIKTLLTRDKTINLSCWLQSMDLDMVQDGNTSIKKLPRKAEELFKYDVIMMLDPNPNEFDAEWLEELKKYLGEHGGGLFYMSGPKYTSRFFEGARSRGITEVLPVQVGRLDASKVEALGVTKTKEWPMILSAAGVDHAMLRLDKDPKVNRRLCEGLPGVFWSYPVNGVKPAATILVEHSDPRLRRRNKPRPLLVSGQYGPGRTVFQGFDGTWRWRKLGEKYFDQYWVQVVRFLVEGRLLGGKKRGRISTDRDVYSIGDRIVINAKLFDRAFKPLEDATLPAALHVGSSHAHELELKAVPNRPGHYEGSAIAAKLGLNELRVQLSPDKDGKRVTATKRFTVEVPRVEFADPRMNRVLLTDLAERTGGKYFDVDEAEQIPQALPDRKETLVVRGKPIELWDTSRLLLLLALLLTVEWALRKSFKLL